MIKLSIRGSLAPKSLEEILLIVIFPFLEKRVYLLETFSTFSLKIILFIFF